MEVRGRVHGNEDVCVAGAAGASNGLVGDRVTAAGHILRSAIGGRVGPGLCRVSQGSNNVQFATDGTFTAFAALSKDQLDADWRTFAESTFKGRVLDKARGVRRLKLPITGSPRV
jgi:hypothetical protein